MIGRERFLRPFRPGGDYQAEEYPAGCAVVDNPPFSILTQIVDWYNAQGVPFFLFGPTLTMLGLMKKPDRKPKICVLLIGAPILYENGAEVQTSFVTNMDRYAVRIEAGLRATIEEISDRLRKRTVKELPKYTYPAEVLTGKDYRLAKYGQTLKIRHEDCVCVDTLDAQRETRKSIFGGGLLLSQEATAERIMAEAAATEQAARQGKGPGAVTEWALSDRERNLVKSMRGGTLNWNQPPAPRDEGQIEGQTDFYKELR